MEKTVCVIGTFDTKEEDLAYLIGRIREQGVNTLVIDAGTGETACPLVDIKNSELVSLAGRSMESLENTSRGDAIETLQEGARLKVCELYAAGRIDAIVGIGGSGGTLISSAAMAELPVGFPKLLVTTLGGTPYVSKFNSDNDIVILNSIVDIAGVNSITSAIYDQAAGLIAGAAKAIDRRGKKPSDKLRIAMTMYGLTTPGVQLAKQRLEELGYEVIVFHATGTGGNAMEKLILSGFFDGVLDMTTTEVGTLALYGYHGDILVSSTRLEAVAARRIPCVVVPGAMDMVTLNGSTPEDTAGRLLYCHNAPDKPSHLRPNMEDVLKTGALLGEKVKKNCAQTAVFFPHGGLSLIDVPGKPMYSPETDELLFKTIREHADNGNTEFFDLPCSVNDAPLAYAAAQKLHEYMKKHYIKI